MPEYHDRGWMLGLADDSNMFRNILNPQATDIAVVWLFETLSTVKNFSSVNMIRGAPFLSRLRSTLHLSNLAALVLTVRSCVFIRALDFALRSFFTTVRLVISFPFKLRAISLMDLTGFLRIFSLLSLNELRSSDRWFFTTSRF